MTSYQTDAAVFAIIGLAMLVMICLGIFLGEFVNMSAAYFLMVCSVVLIVVGVVGVWHGRKIPPGPLCKGPSKKHPYVDDGCWARSHTTPGNWVWRPDSYGVGINFGDVEGPFLNGKRHGHWVERDRGGPVREGPYVEGKRHGHWVFRYANGNVEEGPFVNDEMHGRWVVRTSNGYMRAEGSYVNGEKQGHWAFGYGNGRDSVAEGPMVNDERHGVWIERHDNGNVSDGPYVNGKRHGRWVMQDHDGTVTEGLYVNGEKHGHWVIRCADGREIIFIWENDELIKRVK